MKDYSYLVNKPSPQEILHMDLVCKPSPEDVIAHHGIKGMRWGIRRYQNTDGTLTEAGKKRYGTSEEFERQRKEKILKSPRLVKKHYDELTEAEIAKAKKRFDDIKILREHNLKGIGAAGAIATALLMYAKFYKDAYDVAHSNAGRAANKVIRDTISTFGSKKVADINWSRYAKYTTTITM